MGIGSFFSRIRDGIHNFGQKIKTGFQYIAPKVMKYGGFVTNLLSNLPGKIGKAAGLINNGFNIARKVIGYLPNSEAKNKLENLTNKAETSYKFAKDKYAEPIAGRLKEYGDAGTNILNLLKGNAMGRVPNGNGKTLNSLQGKDIGRMANLAKIKMGGVPNANAVPAVKPQII